jgi:flagellar biosynthesis GTPase FlhF
MARDKENQKRIAREWYERNKELTKQRARDWEKANPEKAAAKKAKWRQENREQYNAINRKWNKNNKPKKAALQSKRRAAILQRTPKWLSPDDLWIIEEAYELAALRTKMFGFPWHVDHIIPLQGRSVSGLHVPTNLQVIPGKENVSKSNKWGENQPVCA